MTNDQDSHGGDYGSLYVEFYDILHAGLEDVEAYLGFASKHGPRVLELGCGTGRILVSLALAGHTVTGVDVSESMLAVCRERLSYEPSEAQRRARLISTDARRLDLPDRFDLVMAACGFIEYFHEAGGVEEVLQTALRHLDKDGVLLMDGGVPDLDHMRKVDGIPREYVFTHPISGSDILYLVTSRYDFAEQIQEDEVRLLERADGTVLRTEHFFEKRRYRFPSQIRAMLSGAGFEIIHEQGALTEEIPVSENGGEMVFLCSRNVYPENAGKGPLLKN